jgi:hypothetical protein
MADDALPFSSVRELKQMDAGGRGAFALLGPPLPQGPRPDSGVGLGLSLEVGEEPF